MAKVFLSVGSNLGDRAALLRQAVARLRTMPGIEFLDASRVYWTEPWEKRPGQSARNQESWFFNCVVSIETTMEPHALLEQVQDVERVMGRTRGAGPSAYVAVTCMSATGRRSASTTRPETCAPRARAMRSSAVDPSGTGTASAA